jgi:hypothetical protein
MFACVSFALALVGCLFFCADADSDCLSDQSTSCSCLCQTPGLEPANTPVILPAGVATSSAFVLHHVKLREVTADIFNPPKA